MTGGYEYEARQHLSDVPHSLSDADAAVRGEETVEGRTSFKGKTGRLKDRGVTRNARGAKPPGSMLSLSEDQGGNVWVPGPKSIPRDVLHNLDERYDHEFEGSGDSRRLREIAGYLQSITGEVSIHDPKIIAIHGTSREALECLLQGTLPGRHELELHFQLGDLSVYPTPQLLATPEIHRGFADCTEVFGRLENDPEMSRLDAISYARNISYDHGFLSTLRLPMETREISDVIDVIDFHQDFTFFLNMGYSEEQIRHAVEVASHKRGFLLGISADILSQPGISLVQGDPGGADITIRPGKNGLSYRFLGAIEPLADDERIY